jgi:hypothetical protein
MRSSIFAQAQIVLLAAVWLLAHPGVATGESIVIRQSWPGTGDCFRIPAAYVEARAGGYLLKLDGMPELVPPSRWRHAPLLRAAAELLKEAR